MLNEVVLLDTRAPVIQISLRTTDLAEARAKWDILERADDELWSSMILGEGVDAATERYETVRIHVTALGFSYKQSLENMNEPLDTILRRIETALLPSSYKYLTFKNSDM